MPKHVAVAIRDPRLRQLVVDRIQSAGAQVLEGASAIDAYNHGRDTTTDLLVLDLHMQDAHGDQVCRDLKTGELSAGLPIVMLIEESDEWFRQRCADAGADVILTYQESGRLVSTIAGILKSERRIHTSGKMDYYLVESSSRNVHTAKVDNISLSGIGCRARECELEAGFKIDVKVSVPDEAPVMGRCTVEKVSPPDPRGIYHIAVSWDGFRSGDRDRLKEWIRRNLAVQAQPV